MYHFVGIKGASMSALAGIMHSLGYEIQGSDSEEYYYTEDELKDQGIKILTPSKDNIKEGMYIIKGNNYTDDNIEIERAKELNLPIYTYQQMVGRLTKLFTTIAVSGTHGKTATTALLSHVIGNIEGCNYLVAAGKGYASKENKKFVVEAREYGRHFLEYHPTYSIITNIEMDHVDYYNNIDDLLDAYRQYIINTEKMVLACGDDRYTKFIKTNRPVFYYGLDEDNEIIAKDVNYTEKGISFDVFVEDNYYGHFDLPIYGKHALLNALAVIGICYYERYDVKEVSKHLKSFTGINKRFMETKVNKTIMIEDYAHHPTQIKYTIKAAKQKYPNKKIITVLEPLNYSRTEKLGEAIAEALNLSDYSYVTDIFKGKENKEDYPNITSDLIIKHLKNGEYIGDDDSHKLVKHKDDVIIFMSPNDALGLKDELIEKLKGE